MSRRLPSACLADVAAQATTARGRRSVLLAYPGAQGGGARRTKPVERKRNPIRDG